MHPFSVFRHSPFFYSRFLVMSSRFLFPHYPICLHTHLPVHLTHIPAPPYGNGTSPFSCPPFLGSQIHHATLFCAPNHTLFVNSFGARPAPFHVPVEEWDSQNPRSTEPFVTTSLDLVGHPPFSAFLPPHSSSRGSQLTRSTLLLPMDVKQDFEGQPGPRWRRR
jgi:hypothetical protein